MLQMWISLCCYLTARVHRPNLHVERQMHVIQAIALSMSCWGLTRGILAEPASRGGVDMASLAAYVQWVHSHSFVLFAQGVFRLSRGLMQPFGDWAHSVGLTCNSATLPYIQLSPVVKRPPGYLGGSLRSYSEVRKGMPVPPPPPSMRTGVMGLWHDALFRNVQRQTYAHMPSVRRGAVLLEHLMQSEVLQPAAVQTMAPTFRLKYPSVVHAVLAVQAGGAQWRSDAPCDMGKWAQAWRSRSLLLAATRDRMIFRPTGDRVWKVFSRLRVPSFDRDFIRRALWRKLTVAQRLCAVTRQDNCPFEPMVETHQHFFEGCQFTEFLGSSIEHTYGQVELEGGGWVAVKHLPYCQSELSLTTTQGLVYWAGLATAWSLRCQRLFMGTLFAAFQFVAALVCKLRVWLHLQNPTLPRAQLRPYLDNLLEWQRTRRLGAKWRSPEGPRPVLSLTVEVRTEWKKQKYAHHIEQTLTALGVLQEKGWDVVFTDGSSKRVRGWQQAGFGGFYGEGDERNFACPLDPQEIQTNGRAEVRVVVFAMRQCTGANPMAIVTDSEFCFHGLTKHILLWERRGWLGFSHCDGWVQILEQGFVQAI